MLWLVGLFSLLPTLTGFPDTSLRMRVWDAILLSKKLKIRFKCPLFSASETCPPAWPQTRVHTPPAVLGNAPRPAPVPPSPEPPYKIPNITILQRDKPICKKLISHPTSHSTPPPYYLRF